MHDPSVPDKKQNSIYDMYQLLGIVLKDNVSNIVEQHTHQYCLFIKIAYPYSVFDYFCCRSSNLLCSELRGGRFYSLL